MKNKKNIFNVDEKSVKRKNILWATMWTIASIGIVAAGVSCGMVYGCSNTSFVVKDVKTSWNGKTHYQCCVGSKPFFDGKFSVFVNGTDCTEQYALNVISHRNIQIDSSGKLTANEAFDQVVYAPIVIEATDRQTNRLIGSETIWINVVEENILPDSVYNIQGNELIGFSQEFINRQDYYSQFNTIKLPERVFTIKDEAFDGKLPNFIKKIIFDEHLQHVGNKAFQNNTFINTVESTGSKFDFSYDVGATFQGCTSLTLVDFSNSEIDNGFPTDCFNGCEALLEVKCAYFMSIGSSCFNGCKSLTTITNCFAVESIFDHAFSGCTNLQTIDFSQSSLDTIGDNAFEHCSSLVTIAFPDCFYSLGKRAFTNCSSLINVDFSRCTKTLNSIGDHAFENCFSLVSIVFPVNNNLVYGLADNVGSGKVVVKKDSTTGKYTWSNNNPVCGSLACGEILFPDGTVEIDEDAFVNCAITSVSFPSSLKSISMECFYECCSLKNVDFSKATQLNAIYSLAFFECTSLTNVDLSSTAVSQIASSAFEWSGLESIHFAYDTNNIDNNAFSNCSSLSEITFDPYTGDQIFFQDFSIGYSAFLNISPAGKVISAHPTVISSQNLLNWLQGNDDPSTGVKGDFPTDGWTAA